MVDQGTPTTMMTAPDRTRRRTTTTTTTKTKTKSKLVDYSKSRASAVDINISAIDQMHIYSKSRLKLMLKPSCSEETIVSTERSPHFKKWMTGLSTH